jgi:hypothetical protein
MSLKMPRFIQPLRPKPIVQPSAHKSIDPVYRLDASEIFLWDLFAQEPINIGGTEAQLFTRNAAKSTIDPVYSEPAQVGWDGPYNLLVHVEWPEQTPEVSEEGMRAVWPSGAWIPRKTLEQIGARPPQRGDILRFWKLPVFDTAASDSRKSPIASYYFDVLKANDTGHLFDTAAFVGYQLDLKRKTSFGPEEQLVEGNATDRSTTWNTGTDGTPQKQWDVDCDDKPI